MKKLKEMRIIKKMVDDFTIEIYNCFLENRFLKRRNRILEDRIKLLNKASVHHNFAFTRQALKRRAKQEKNREIIRGN